MKKITTITLAALTAISFSSCATSSHAQHKAGMGAAIGAGVGGLLGHQSGKAGEGAALGALLGGTIGHAAGSEQDKREGRDTTYYNKREHHDPYYR